ncbi:MAG: hypothetical protein ACN6O2_03115 [Stenotrophomonas sp.]|uniref:hypothetical protein n=1 Tax=Stenotrophomonas sp. TaxID=69392 RepID=UPI0028A64C4D|nr:hypothetical protein [Stenotrophomonas sp.]
MTDIASSLEREFADVSHSEREAAIAELRKCEAAGRGSVDIKPHAIMLPALFILCGGIFVYGAFTSGAMSRPGAIGAFALGALMVLGGLWAMLGPRKARFSLTERGIVVNDALLPWVCVEDYGVVENSYNGFSTHTSVTVLHAPGFTPPPLGLMYLFGAHSHNRKTGQYETRLTLHAGARGMNCEKLANRIGDFLAASHARDELSRMQATDQVTRN